MRKALKESPMTDIHSLPLNFASVRASLAQGLEPIALITESYRRAKAVAEAGIFTALVPEADVIRHAESLAHDARSGRILPLLGLSFSVKDNIHVAGMATTANCPALSIFAAESAPVVTALEGAGAVMIGKNAMDQFATGLTGTRSPRASMPQRDRPRLYSRRVKLRIGRCRRSRYRFVFTWQ